MKDPNAKYITNCTCVAVPGTEAASWDVTIEYLCGHTETKRFSALEVSELFKGVNPAELATQ